MMNVTYSADVEHLDEPIYEAAAERPGLPIRIRLQPSIFRRPADGTVSGQHRSWVNVSWVLECSDVAEALALRQAMQIFFEAVGQEGPATIAERIGRK